ncbi:MAG: hypothetical protein AAGI44_14430 [Pseudomonadota bacterium]
MPQLLRQLNYRNIVLGDETNGQSVGVVLRSAETRYVPWCGFIPLSLARRRPRAVPVKLVIKAVSDVEAPMQSWIYLEHGQYIQGCLVEEGAYGVLVNGHPRIISA